MSAPTRWKEDAQRLGLTCDIVLTYMPRPRTIQIFLPDGNASSVRIAEITSRTVQAVQVPRTQLELASARDEIRLVGVYFLFARGTENAKPRCYIGEAEDCLKRLTEHHRSKDFWQQAVAITSKTRSYTKAHAKYLEWHCLTRAREAQRFALANNAMPSKPYIPEPIVADLLDDFDTMRVLLSTLGFPLFEAPAATVAERVRPSYTCAGRGAKATGALADDGFLVRSGSTMAPSLTPSAEDSWVERLRDALVRDGVAVSDDDGYTFAEDYVFDSPSAAAASVLGRHANGWTSWKDAQGRTLDANERQ
jgi:hypothetical protein